MKSKPSKFLEQHRIIDGPMLSDKSFGNNGAFDVVYKSVIISIIVSDQDHWDHVSVHATGFAGERTPKWDEMCYVKGLFFKPSECAIQFHPARSCYVNTHPHVLHLWRHQSGSMRMPPREMV